MEVDNLNSKRKELNEETRGQIVGMSRAGSSKREISKVLGIPKSTVHNILLKYSKTLKKKTNTKASQKTIHRSLHNLGFFSRIPTQKPLLTDVQMENRLNWCLEKQSWSIRKWGNVIWSDESRFAVFNNDGPNHVWRTC
ncbi:834_t:CDS:2, partial [Entrophospora sp. SA101]